MREEARRYVLGGCGTLSFGEALLAESNKRDVSLKQSRVELRFGTPVRGIEPSGDGWRLAGECGALGGFDWLVVSARTVMHPDSWQGPELEPPLVSAARARDDRELSAAIDGVIATGTRPAVVMLMAFEGAAARAWAALPWMRVRVKADSVLAHIVVQRVHDGITSVAVHATAAFAKHACTTKRHDHVDASVLKALLGALEAKLVPQWLAERHLCTPSWGPRLHYWPAGFPTTLGIDPSVAVARSARVAFCGDFVANPRFGSIERAALSGLGAARAIGALLPQPAN
eukprot:gnl/TRDRNA2_/TRDRNA2_53631_c0_seq1.p1 gnl/TRDRNA2_/TRDRNA2_53631_c0~~gnl/TRDRNA2_/TRDRNA2_53631_c0_seq1.p1  ORF type:complete len:286 (+),score=42.11 gnl/TRDRNA2_/TRDRNA2_53631_c0_seq1:126-983(+)